MKISLTSHSCVFPPHRMSTSHLIQLIAINSAKRRQLFTIAKRLYNFTRERWRRYWKTWNWCFVSYLVDVEPFDIWTNNWDQFITNLWFTVNTLGPLRSWDKAEAFAALASLTTKLFFEKINWTKFSLKLHISFSFYPSSLQKLLRGKEIFVDGKLLF